MPRGMPFGFLGQNIAFLREFGHFPSHDLFRLFRLSELVLRGTARKWDLFQNIKGRTQLKTVLHYVSGENPWAWESRKSVQETLMFVLKQRTVCQTLAEIQCPWNFWQNVVCSGLVG